MAVQADGNAPYAPFSVIRAVIERHRHVGLQMITLEVLGRLGVTESLTSRSLQALKLLDLVDEEGRPTPTFESIRKASTDDLSPCLTQLIRQAYEPVFAIIDPMTATPQQLSDAFRGFKPPGQRERMVTLFTGLMAFAGMIESVPKRTPGPRPQTRGEQTNGVRTARQAAPTADSAPITAKAPDSQQADAHARTVTLRTGGSITLSVDMNPLVLRGSERKFFNALVDLLDEYEDDSPLALPAGTTIMQQEV